MKHIQKILAAPLVLAGGLALSQAALAGSGNCPAGIDLAGNPDYVQFGDAISYSLPILGIDVQSSPGQIGGCIIVTSGPGGVLTNTGGGVVMDNAYNNEQGGTQPYFQTGTANAPDPGPTPFVAEFTGDQPNTWDIQVSALQAFLAGGSPVFYFNHNQTNSGSGGTTPSIDQDLFIWAQLILYDSAHNPVLVCNLQSVPGGAGNGLDFNFGVPTGTPGDCLESQTLAQRQAAVVGAGFPATSDFVRASGQVCIDNTTQDVVSCFNPDGSAKNPKTDNITVFNENLGANDVANEVLVPSLSTFLAANPNFDGTMSIDLRMGCKETGINASDTYLDGTDQAFLDGPGNCPLGSVTNNGYEQVFIVAGPQVHAPEPQTLALLGLGVIAVAWATRKARKA